MKEKIKNIIHKIPNKNTQDKIKYLLKNIYIFGITPYRMIIFLNIDKNFKKRLNKMIAISKAYNFDNTNKYYFIPNLNEELLSSKNGYVGGGSIKK